MLEKIKVLFVCIHNSARSQMAETFLNSLCPDKFYAESAGIEPGVLNQNVVAVMKEIGFDISNNKTKSVFDLFKKEKKYDFVITVCDKEAAEQCPIFPGKAQRFHWSFSDPSGFTGDKEEVLNKVRVVRDKIKNRIEQFCNEI